MDTVISIKDLGLICIFTALTVLLVYLIVLVKNSIETVKRTNKILADTEEMTALANKRTKDLDGIVENVSTAVGAATESFKGKESSIKSLSNLVSAISSLIGMIKKKGND